MAEKIYDVEELVAEQIKALPEGQTRTSLMHLMAISDPWLDRTKLEVRVDWSGEDYDGAPQGPVVHTLLYRFHKDDPNESAVKARVGYYHIDEVPLIRARLAESGIMAIEFDRALKNCCDHILWWRKMKSELVDMRKVLTDGVTTTA